MDMNMMDGPAMGNPMDNWQENDNGDWNYDEPLLDGNRYNNAFGDYVGGYGPIGYRRGPGGPPPDVPFIGPVQDFSMGQGYGPGGPPMRRSNIEDKAFKYLLRCGLSADFLRTLPRALLMQVEPQRCGVCGMEFDSFATSRIHYTSKNHFKKQKKWLNYTQKNSGNSFRGREAPLKARELYCELCDVHITSKSHADAHYAGKPHRSIVEGRKVPKNGVLLQPANRNRLEQLVRREKRHLKALAEAEPSEQVNLAPKEAKPVSPELYCNVCKTSVTCTEQMTMHLNGKKHLMKEKQYILRMMRGEAPPAANEPQQSVAEECADEADGEGDLGAGAGSEVATIDISGGGGGGGDAQVDAWAEGSGEGWTEY